MSRPAQPDALSSSMRHLVCAGGARYPVRVTVESRANVRVSIGRQAVHIRLPQSLAAGQRAEAIDRMLRWAERTVERRGLAPRPPWRDFRDGETLTVDGRTWTLLLQESDRRTASARAEGDAIRVLLPRSLAPAERGRAVTLLSSRVLAREALPRVRAMVEEANRRAFRRPVSAVRLKYMRSHWGSCSRAGAINLSTRLLLAPPQARAYVCVHELAHLVERGHTPAFWKAVERAMPDWKRWALWLRRNGDRLWF